MKSVLYVLLIMSAVGFGAANHARDKTPNGAQVTVKNKLEPWDTVISAETVRAEFQQLYTALESAHLNLYVHRAKSQYDALYAQMLKKITQPMSLFDMQVMFQKFVAYGDVAHAKIDFPEAAYQQFRAEGGRILPVYLRIVEGRAFVGENYSNNPKLKIGDEILGLNGQSIAHWLELTAGNISADTPYIAHSLLEFMFPKYLWLELGEIDIYKLTIKRNDKTKTTIDVLAQTQAQMQATAMQRPQRFNLASDARTAEMLNSSIAYLRPGPFYNIEDPTSLWDNTGFIKFVDDAFQTFIDRNAQTLIIDLRTNPGGDNSFSDPMLAWVADRPFRFVSRFLIKSSDQAAASNQARLNASPGAVESISTLFAKKYEEVPRGDTFEFEIPYVQPRQAERFNGDVYVLINRHSYSNAVNVAAIVQDYGFGIIVGEKTSDMATTYGAMETFKLKTSGIKVSFPKAHIIRPSGNTKSDGVTPDLVIQSPLTFQRDDVVLSALVSTLKAK